MAKNPWDVVSEDPIAGRAQGLPVQAAAAAGGWEVVEESRPEGDAGFWDTTAEVAKSAAHGLTGVASDFSRGRAVATAQRQTDMREMLDRLDKADLGESFTPKQVLDAAGGGPLAERVLGSLIDYVQYPELREQMRSDDFLIYGSEDPREQAMYRVGQNIDRGMDEKLPLDPQFDDSFLVRTVPGAIGSMAGYVGAGAAGGVVGGPAGALATTTLAGIEGGRGNEFNRAIAEGATLDEAIDAANLSAVVGASEAVPIMSVLRRADKASGGGITRRVRDMLVDGTEEAVQEAGADIARNLIASDVVGYNPDRETFEGTGESAGAGFTAGALMSFLSSLVGGRRGGAPREAAPEASGEQPVAGQDGAASESGEAWNVVDEQQAPTQGAEPQEDAPREAPPISPAARRQQDFEQRARSAGLNAEQMEALRPDETPDSVTGFFKAEDRVPTLERAQQYVAETADDAVYVEADIANLGGLNAARGHSGANQVYRGITDIMNEELGALGVEVVPFRHGGDEVSAVVVGADRPRVEEAMSRAQTRIREYISGEGLADLPHTKSGGRSGVGLSWGVAEITPDAPLEDIFSLADNQVEEGKKAYVDGSETGEAGTPAPEGQAGGAAESPAGGDQERPQARGRLEEEAGADARGDAAQEGEAGRAGVEPPPDLAGTPNETPAPAGVSNDGQAEQAPQELGAQTEPGAPPGVSPPQPVGNDQSQQAASTEAVTVKTDGKPFQTRKAVELSTRFRRTPGAVPVEVDGGWGFTVPNAESGSAPGLTLETQTEESLAARERERQQAERADSDRRQQDEQRAQADADSKDFRLTGSDRSADVQAAGDQQDFLGEQPKPRRRVGVEGMSGEFDVVDDSDPSMVKVRNARGTELKVGRARLRSLDEAAHEAATSPRNDAPEPSEAQKEAGNYKLGHVRLHGLDISIENPKGSKRRGTAPDGTPWESTLKNHYGYIRGTEGRDGDHVDVFLGPEAEAESPGIFVIDQVDPDTRRFDEHKVMLGFPSREAAEKAYRANYAKGWEGLSGIKEMSLDEFKDWLANGDLKKRAARPVPKKTPAKQEPKQQDDSRKATRKRKRDNQGSQPIGDFGEKIAGARKDAAAVLQDSLADESLNVLSAPLSKSFPQPNYEKLAEAGVPAENLALVAVIRAEIPPKPRRPGAQRRWAEAVSNLRWLASRLLDRDPAKRQEGRDILTDNDRFSPLVDTARVVQGLPPALLGKAGQWRVKAQQFSLFQGVKFEQPTTLYVLYDDKGRMTTVHARTAEDIAAPAQAEIQRRLENAPKRTRRPTPINVYRDVSAGDYFLGFKARTGVIRLKTGFASGEAARAHREENADALQEQINAIRRGPAMRGAENAPREGEPRREGDVTPEMFQEAFSFRGVQFGNYVEGGRRQQDLNQAFDALMDLSEVLGVPPRALSLNGELGLAFGARGKGGRAMAHYEPGQVVINLTKTQGAGSLAHEWLHATDHYFARQDAQDVKHVDYMSRRQRGDGQDFGSRDEVYQAWKAVEHAITRGEFSRRSATFDAGRTKPYFGTTIEKAARAFERYVYDRLAERGVRNDYLANINLDGGVYPTAKEMREEGIRQAFDQLFQTIETRETDQGVAMFRRGEETPTYSRHSVLDSGSQPQGMSIQEVERAVAPIIEELGGMRGLGFSIQRDAQTAFGPGVQGPAAAAKGATYPRSRHIVLIAANLDNARDARETLRHEVLAHYGLNLFPQDVKARFLEAVSRSRSEPSLRKVWAEIDQRYADLDEMGKAEEVVARLAEDHRNLAQRLWDRVVEVFRWALRKVGLVPNGLVTRSELYRELDSIAKGIRRGYRPLTVPESDQSQFRRDDATDTPQEPGPGAGFSASEVTAFVRPLLQRWSERPPVRVVQSEQDLPGYLSAEIFSRIPDDAPMRPEGVYDTLTGAVYVIADNAQSEASVQRTVLHEVRGHYGLRRLMGADLDPLLRQIWASYGRDGLAEIAQRNGVDLNTEDGRLVAAEEKLAELSESGEAPTLVDRAVALVRDWLRAVAPNLRLTDAELRALIGRVDAFMEGRDRADAMVGERAAARFNVPDDKDVLRRAREKAGLGKRRRPLGQFVTDLQEATWSGIKEFVRERMDGATQGGLDRFYGIKRAEQRVAGNLPAEQSGYVAARLSTGTASIMRAILNYGAPRWGDGILEQVPDSKGLLQILEPVRGDIDTFLGWMVARRAQRLMEEGRENLFSAEEIAALTRAGERSKHYEQFEAVSEELAEFKSRVLDVAEEAGLIDPTTRPAWDQADYIPFYRVADTGDTQGPRGGGAGLAGQSSGIRTLKGGTAALNDPLENLIMNFTHLMDASLKNHAIRQVSRNVDGAGLLSPAQQEFKAELIPTSQIAAHLREHGVDPATLPKDALAGMRKMMAMKPPQDPDVVRIMEDGRPKYYRVHDPLLLRALTAVRDPGLNHPIVKAMRGFKRVLTRSVTATPEFMIRNFLRDVLSAWVINKDRFTPGVDSLRGAAKTLRDKGGALDMMFAGGSFLGGYVNASDPGETARAVRGALRQKGYDAAARNRYVSTVIDTPLKWWEVYTRIGDAVENANREAVFESAEKAGKTKAQAVFEAKDLMDFSLRGDWALYQFFADVIPFLNARVQGLYRLGRSDLKQAFARGSVIALASLALLALNKDDERYKALEEWEKDMYWWFWVGDEAIKIPKPFEVGVAFATIPERMAMNALGQDTNEKSYDRFLWNVMQVFAFDPVPQAVNPMLEVWGERNRFLDRPIENMADEGKLPAARYNTRTSDTMVALGSVISNPTGLSPKELEHLYRGYLGSVGMYALAMSDTAVRALNDAPPRPALRLSDYPILSGIMESGPAFSTKYQTELYDLHKEVDQIYRTIRAYREEGKIDEAKALLEQERPKLRARGLLKNMVQLNSRINDQLTKIQRSETLSPDEKRERIDDLLRRRADALRKGVTRVQEVVQD